MVKGTSKKGNREMIRFINLGDQIIEDEKQFAWYDTVRSNFLEYNGSYVWDTWEEFEEDYSFELRTPTPTAAPNLFADLERFKNLFPKDWKEEPCKLCQGTGRLPITYNPCPCGKQSMVELALRIEKLQRQIGVSALNDLKREITATETLVRASTPIRVSDVQEGILEHYLKGILED